MTNDAPAITFDSLGLNEQLLKAVREAGWEHPTPIQAKAIPPVLAGRDLLGCAQTGTGKTGAFLLPTLQRILATEKGGTRVLVLEPTRELAAQVDADFKELAKHVPLKCQTVYGGVSFGPQIQALRHNTDVIVATPGRLLDHMERGNCKLDRLQVFILDEADRMMDMGFMPDLRRIVRMLPKVRQTLFFSATIPPEIERLTREILTNPVQIDVGRRPLVATGITHAVYPVAQNLKTALLTLLLRTPGMGSVLVFTRTKHRAERLYEQLKVRGFNADCLHGDRSQGQREQALEQFRDGKIQVMVATDIAARGLDIQDITHVINYDVPNTAEDYVHRIGRTGRANAVGDAFTLVSFAEEAAMGDIERSLAQALPRVIRPDFDYGPAAPMMPPPVIPKAADASPAAPPVVGMHSTRRSRGRRR
jgi:ATP-dependent RNA helicase RhlE